MPSRQVRLSSGCGEDSDGWINPKMSSRGRSCAAKKMHSEIAGMRAIGNIPLRT
jgi:hypothetical protein